MNTSLLNRFQSTLKNNPSRSASSHWIFGPISRNRHQILFVCMLLVSESLFAADAKDLYDSDLLGVKEWVIVFMPVVLFLILTFVITRSLRGENFLSNALVEKSHSTGTEAAQSESGDDGENPSSPKSTSRFVLMLSGVSAVLIAVSMVTYHFYAHQAFSGTGDPDVDFTNLMSVLLTLGIGVAPYTIRKLANS